MALRVAFHFDILCPHSYLAHQLLARRLPRWRALADVQVDHVPVIGPKIFRCARGSLYDGICAQQRAYIGRELNSMAELYGLKAPAEGLFLGGDLLDKRSISSLLFLVHLKRIGHPLFLSFVDAFFERVWLNDFPVTKVARMHRIGREIGVSFREMDDLLARVETPANVSLLLGTTNALVNCYALGTPWIVLEWRDRAYSFCEVPRIDVIEPFLRNPETLPVRVEVPDDRRGFYPVPNSVFFEDYSM